MKGWLTINSCLTADATANYIPDFLTMFHVFQYERSPRFALEGQVSAREVRNSQVKLSSVGSGLVKRLLSYRSTKLKTLWSLTSLLLHKRRDCFRDHPFNWAIGSGCQDATCYRDIAQRLKRHLALAHQGNIVYLEDHPS